MGLFQKLFGKKTSDSAPEPQTTPTLEQDILSAAEWVVTALNTSGYKADYTLESMKEVDRFFDEQSGPDGILSRNRGQILFALGSYVGQTAIKLHGGNWITDDSSPEGEINASVKLSDGTLIWPIIRCMKRYQAGNEESLFAYLYALSADIPTLKL
ncbi:MAG: hypothetical protein IKT67_02945 [Lachnospiraceae bacterium]|nr:hypothetical protein [Lachnospiraceae bacterium]